MTIVNVQVFTVKIETTRKGLTWDAEEICTIINSALGTQTRCTMVSEVFGDHKPTSSLNKAKPKKQPCPKCGGMVEVLPSGLEIVHCICSSTTEKDVVDHEQGGGVA